MLEKKESVVKFDSAIVSPGVFDEILNHIYTSDLKFTEENAIPICVAADYFRDEDLMQKTENFLRFEVARCDAKFLFKTGWKVWKGWEAGDIGDFGNVVFAFRNQLFRTVQFESFEKYAGIFTG